MTRINLPQNSSQPTGFWQWAFNALMPLAERSQKGYLLPACDTPFQPHFSRQFPISPSGIRPFMRSNKRRRSSVMVTLS